MPPLLLYFEDQAQAARNLAQEAGLAAAEVLRHRFPDGELRLTLPFAAPTPDGGDLPDTVVLYRSLNDPNEKLVEVLLLAAQAKAWGVKRLILVAPYLAYMRQDISFHPGEVVSQRQLGRLLALDFDALITVDPHLHRIDRLEQAVPVRQALALSAAPLLASHVAHALQADCAPSDIVLIGPDSESAPWIEAAARTLGCAQGVCSKVRLGDHRVEVTLPDLPVHGRRVVLLDDIASSGRTLATAAQGLLQRGANSVDVAVTHALLAHDALAVIRGAGVRQFWSSDSVGHVSNAVRLAPLLAPALKSTLTPGLKP
jgi:ribose-phosphate pyrophosphokinase